MARILFINSVCYGSTGTICKNLYKAAEKEGHVCCLAYGRGKAPTKFKTIKIGNKLVMYIHILKARLFDASGFGSKRATKKFIKEIEKYNPDIIHIHNLHGYYLNIEILFKYLKDNPQIKKIWTLHDCWAFTGHCPHFEYEKCEKWKNCCENCIRKKEYPKTLIDRSKKNYNLKKSIFCQVPNLLLVTPSFWLANLVTDSFISEYNCNVISNGIDMNIFKYSESNLRKKYKIEDKIVILGIASIWQNKKGLQIYKELANLLNDEYVIVMIGLSTRQIKKIPKNIIAINRTENMNELVEWYSTADIFFNPTYEENYPTVNLEAQACNTPVYTYEVGGSKETIFLNTSKIFDINTIPKFKKKENVELSQELKEQVNVETMCKKYLRLYN